MAQVKIVTDSSVYLPDPNLVSHYGVEVIPLTVRIGAQTYPERINHIDETFLRKQAQYSENVSVETPSTGQIHAFFSRLSHQTDSIVCIHTSSALHNMNDAVRRGAAGFIGRHRIIVLDTLSMSVGAGLIVEAAAHAAAAGATQAEIVKIVRGMIPHMYALVFSDSLHYLEAWGRLGTAQTMLGTMLGLKPLSTMEDGDLIPVEKVRNYDHAVDKLYDFIIEFSRIKQMYLIQQDFESEAAQLLERLEIAFPRHEFPVIGYPPSLAVHFGPKALGVIVHEGTR